VRADAVFGPVVDRPHEQVDGLQGAEGALDVGQRLVVAHRVLGTHALLGQAGAHDVDAVEGGFLGDALLV